MESMKLSKLPPRMQADEEKRLANPVRANSYDDFQFCIAPPKNVPDFNRIHREFAAKLEANKSAVKLTEPKPFNFHDPKLDPDLKKHLNDEN